MTEALLVLVTCPDHATGERIAKTLVEERLAACVNLKAGITSYYRWEGAVTQDEEVLLIIKTRGARFPELERRVIVLHPYDVPEIIALPIVEGSAGYLQWIDESTQ